MNELLLSTELDDEQRAYAEQVARSGEHMLAIINDILDISKIETGRLDLELGRLRPARDGRAGLRAGRSSRPQAKGLELEIEIDRRAAGARARRRRARAPGADEPRRQRRQVHAEGSVDASASRRDGGRRPASASR